MIIDSHAHYNNSAYKNPSYFQKQFREAIKKVEGVRALTPHSCRHTYVSQLQGLGVDMETIKSIVGHAEIDMTQHYRTYRILFVRTL